MLLYTWYDIMLHVNYTSKEKKEEEAHDFYPHAKMQSSVHKARLKNTVIYLPLNELIKFFPIFSIKNKYHPHI